MATKSTNIIKERNMKLLLRVLRKNGLCTKSELAKESRLSVVTVNALTKELLDTGQIILCEKVQPSIGRPADTYKFNPKYKVYLTIYIHEVKGSTYAFYRVYDLQGDIIESSQELLKTIDVNSFDKSIEAFMEKNPAIEMIGLGIPGRESDGIIVSCDYENLVGEKLTPKLKEQFGCDVLFFNDVNALAMGYRHERQNSKKESIVCIYFPASRPPGGAAVLDGNLINGWNSYAGKIEYLSGDTDWESFKYETEKVTQITAKIIQAYMCTINPEMIAVYSEAVDEKELIRELIRLCSCESEKLMIPDIEVLPDVGTSFERGLSYATLEKLLQKEVQ